MKSHKRDNFKSVFIGFLIIVGAFIIGVIVTAWQAMSRSGNESNAVFVIGLFHKKQNQYASEHSGKFASTFTELGGFGKEFSSISSNRAVSGGYNFTIKVREPNETSPAFYSISAEPQVYYLLFPAGNRRFHFDSTLKSIRVTEENRQATASDPPS